MRNVIITKIMVWKLDTPEILSHFITVLQAYFSLAIGSSHLFTFTVSSFQPLNTPK